MPPIDFFPKYLDYHIEDSVCIIMGNGPSIGEYDLTDPFFTDNITIGSNAIGKVFTPTYYLIADATAYKRYKHFLFSGKSIPIVGKPIIKDKTAYERDTVFVEYRNPTPIGPPTRGKLYSGRTSGIVMLHVAYNMGFKYVFLLGLDGYIAPGVTHFFGNQPIPKGTDYVVAACLKKAVEVFRKEDRFLFNLSVRSIYGSVPLWPPLLREYLRNKRNTRR